MLSRITSFFFETPIKERETNLENDVSLEDVPLGIRIRFHHLGRNIENDEARDMFLTSDFLAESLALTGMAVMEWLNNAMEAEARFIVTSSIIGDSIIITMLPRESNGQDWGTAHKSAMRMSSAIAAVAARKFSAQSIQHCEDCDVTARVFNFEHDPEDAEKYLYYIFGRSQRQTERPVPVLFIKRIAEDYKVHSGEYLNWLSVLTNDTFEDDDNESDHANNESDSEVLPPPMEFRS